MVTVKIQCRLEKDSYDLMMKNLSDDESVSDFIRKAVQLENTLRLLGKDD
jgi:hypothetical protein